MKIIEEYKSVKKEHSDFFRKFTPKDRLKYSEQIVTLKRRLDELELRIVNGILNFTLDYNRTYNDLKSVKLHHFLDDNIGISRFLTNQKISRSIGYDERKRNQVINDFKDLCKKVWEDYIITSEEREELNDFCKRNFIDRTQQFLIEQEISKKYTDGFDLIKIVEYYFKNENLTDKEIKEIIDREYKKKVPLARIIFITSQLNKQISEDIDLGENKSKLIKTINFNDILNIYLIVVNGNITSGFEFEIGYIEGEKDSLKIMISKKMFNDGNETRLIDLITDGLCYKLCSSNMNLREFLEKKSMMRDEIQSLF